MTATSVVCPECGSPVEPGRLSCQSCGTLLASVVGSTRRYEPTPVVDPMLPDVDEDRPIASARRESPDREPLPAPPVPIEVETQVAVPPTQPARRAPRRLPRPKPAAAPMTPAAAVDVDAQTSIFGPVPNVAPPILHSWAASAPPNAAPNGVGPAVAPTRAQRPPRPQPQATLAPPRNGSAPSAKSEAATGMAALAATAVQAAPEDGTAVQAAPEAATAVQAAPASVAGAYLAPSATYAAPVADRSAILPTTSSPALASRSSRSTAPLAAAVTPTWPNPAGAAVAAGGQNGSFVDQRSAAASAAASPTGSAGAAVTPTSRRMSDWLVIGGSTLAIVSFVLPWATDGVLGSKGIGYTAEWGLANLGHLLLVMAAMTILVTHVIDNRIPVWIRSAVLPTAAGGLLGGLAFAYYARPFGGGTGVAVLLAGAVLLLAGGVVASRPDRNETGAPTV